MKGFYAVRPQRNSPPRILKPIGNALIAIVFTFAFSTHNTRRLALCKTRGCGERSSPSLPTEEASARRHRESERPLLQDKTIQAVSDEEGNYVFRADSSRATTACRRAPGFEKYEQSVMIPMRPSLT